MDPSHIKRYPSIHLTLPVLTNLISSHLPLLNLGEEPQQGVFPLGSEILPFTISGSAFTARSCSHYDKIDKNSLLSYKLGVSKLSRVRTVYSTDTSHYCNTSAPRLNKKRWQYLTDSS